MLTCRASHVKTGNRAKYTQSVHVRDTMDCLIAGDVCRAEKCGNMSAVVFDSEVGQLVGAVGGVDVDQYGADLCGGELGQDPLGVVGGPDADVLPRPDRCGFSSGFGLRMFGGRLGFGRELTAWGFAGRPGFGGRHTWGCAFDQANATAPNFRLFIFGRHSFPRLWRCLRVLLLPYHGPWWHSIPEQNASAASIPGYRSTNKSIPYRHRSRL